MSDTSFDVLRRRNKAPKLERHETPAPQRGRRRARADAPVPEKLLLREPRGGTNEPVVLVTGFEPFGGERANPSWEICMRLPRLVGGLRVATCRVPCEFGRSIAVLEEAIARLRPAAVVLLGQAGGRAHVCVERVAINVDDSRLPDNAGACPVDAAVVAGGPPAYFATLPVKAIVGAMRKAGVPAEVSNSAGTYVCNHLMYGVLHYLAANGSQARAGFVHVPYAEEQVLDKPGVAALSLATMVRGVEAALSTLAP